MPIDYACPSQRLKYMVEDSETSALISCRSLWATNSFNYPADNLVAEEVTDVVEAYPSDNFTSLGGNSLLAMKFSTLLRVQGIKISTTKILQLITFKFERKISSRFVNSQVARSLKKEPVDSRKSPTNFKQMTIAKLQIPPDMHIHSKNFEPKMVFVHTGNGSS